MDYEFTRINAARLPDLLGIFESAFGRAPDLSDLEAKHDTAFTGTRDMGFVAYARDGTPAGFYGIFPVMARIDGQIRRIAQSGDTMVAKEHGGKGLFTRLARRTYEQALTEGVEGVFGFPSASSYPGFVRKLDWIHPANIQRFAFMVPTVPFSELGWRWRATRAILRAWQRLLLRAFRPGTFFVGQLMREDGDCILRDQKYWNYKLANRDVIAIQVMGVNTIVKLEGSLGIGDVDTRDPMVLKKVLGRLRLFCFFTGIGRMRTYVSPLSPQAAAFGALVNPTEGLPIGYANFNSQTSLAGLRYCYLDMDSF